MWLGPTFLTVSAGQNVDEARPSIRADEIADAVQQQSHCEQKHQGDPGPDSRSRGRNDPVNEQVGDDHERDRIDGKVQRSKRINTGSGIKTAHIPLPLRAPPKGGERPAALTRNGSSLSAASKSRRAAGRAPRLLVA